MADVKLLKYDGTEQQYRGVERVQLAKIDGGTAIFSEGEALEGVEISPDFSSGDMTINSTPGTLVKSAVIKQPEALVPGNIRKGVNVAGIVGDLVGDTEERTVELVFPEGDGGEEELFPEQTVSGFSFNQTYGCFVTPVSPVPFVPTLESEYIVEWDGERFTRTAFSFTAPDGASCIGVGNTVVTGVNSGEPFLICYDSTNGYFYFFSTQEADSHTVAVYRNAGSSFGDIVITPTQDGKVMSKVTVKKPETLVPENILSGVEIGGVTGELEVPEQVETEVDLDFSGGDMEVVPLEGKVFRKVNIPVPEGLIPENIVKGVTIAGIEGISEGGGGGFDDKDENLKYFAYKVDGERREVILYAILYSQLYTDKGSYDVAIPNTLGGYNVVIASEGAK